MEYTAIRSSLEISRDMADYLEAADPQKYPPASRAQTIREINDILTGRSDAPFDSPLGRARDKRAIELMADFAALSIQVKQMELPSPFKRGRAQKYPLWNVDAETPLKWIDQKRYDSAVRNGFPDGFLSNHISTVFRSMTCRTTWIARDRPLPIAALPPAASKERSLRTVPCVIQTFQIVDWISACSHTRACRTSGSLTARSIRAALRFRSSKALLFWIAAWNRSIWETVRWTAVPLHASGQEIFGGWQPRRSRRAASRRRNVSVCGNRPTVRLVWSCPNEAAPKGR